MKSQDIKVLEWIKTKNKSSEDSVNACFRMVDVYWSAFVGEALSKITASSTFKMRFVKLTTILFVESS